MWNLARGINGHSQCMPRHAFGRSFFQKRAERKIKLVDPFDLTRYGPTTCVRMAYKAYQLSFPFSHDFYGIDPTDGTIAESQKKKVDEMAKWDNSPFHEYQCRRVRSHFVIQKKHSRVKCEHCVKKWSNISCCNCNTMCRTCCIEHGGNQCRVHKK